MQGAILLIAAKRSDDIASQLAQHDFDTDSRAADRIEELYEIVNQLAVANHDLVEQNNLILGLLSTPLEVADPGDVRSRGRLAEDWGVQSRSGP